MKLNIIEKLSFSKFRSSFKLLTKDIEYINKNGLDIIKEHAYKFISDRIKPAYIANDGKQTPTKGHPVFVAMHATATCCRECIYKWHKIKKNKELNEKEIDYIVSIIMFWITKQYNSCL